MIEHNRQHPDIHQPWERWSEDQTLHLVMVYNNPFRWETRRRLFNQAIRQMLAMPNLIVYAVELAFDQRPYEVTDPTQADYAQSAPGHRVDIQLRTDSVLWHKERLINLGVRAFPPGWRYGGYCDADFSFTRWDWALEAIHMLQHHQFVQLFSSYTDITGHMPTSWEGSRPYRMSSSFAWNYMHQAEFKASMERRRRDNNNGGGRGGGDSYAPQMAMAMAMGPVFPYGMAPGATGGAWAWRRQAFTTVGGLLDTCILGSGDWHMAFGLAESTNVAAEMKRCTRPYMNKVLQWQERAMELKMHPGKSAIGCIDQHVIHQFHGSKTRRQYGERWKILQQHQFDPDRDITQDWQGVWRWTGNKPGLRDDVQRYFVTRVEDDPILREGERPLV